MTRSGDREAEHQSGDSSIGETRRTCQTPAFYVGRSFCPLTIPQNFFYAHADLVRAVDRCYRSQLCTSDRQRAESLFELYEQMSSTLLYAPEKTKRRSKNIIFSVAESFFYLADHGQISFSCPYNQNLPFGLSPYCPLMRG